MVTSKQIEESVRGLAIKANFELTDDVVSALEKAAATEESPTGQKVFASIKENARLAAEERLPLCQDTGSASVFVDLGQDARIEGDMAEAVTEGIRQGYREANLRKSMVADPIFDRQNTGDNTPAFIHVRIIPGEELAITVMPKGGGCDNASRLVMLRPTTALETLKDFVLGVVEEAGPDACPPLAVGVGIGGNFDTVATLAKRALLRPLSQPNADERLATLEEELLSDINDLGIGPGGFGGRITAFKVAMEMSPCHMASLPVAVNLSCHSLRRAKMSL